MGCDLIIESRHDDGYGVARLPARPPINHCPFHSAPSRRHRRRRRRSRDVDLLLELKRIFAAAAAACGGIIQRYITVNSDETCRHAGTVSYTGTRSRRVRRALPKFSLSRRVEYIQARRYGGFF